MAQLLIQAGTQAELIALCAQEILSTGEFEILPLHVPETREEFCVRVGISKRNLYRRLRNKFVKETGVRVERGGKGRLLMIRSTARFDEFARTGRIRGQNSPCSTMLGASFPPAVYYGER